MLVWQRDYLADESRLKFAVASRQSGKSHVGALEDVIDSQKRKTLSVILSAGERQSLEVLEKVRMHTQAIGAALDSVEDTYFRDTSLLQHTAKYANGSRIIALPANPDTARGYSANVRLDEFGIIKDSRAIWAALVPSITRGYKLRVTSTFKGTDNEFYKLGRKLGLHLGERPAAQPVQAHGWSGHWVDIHMVAEQARRCPDLGLKVDPEELRRAVDDEDIWQQEFCNIPMEDGSAYIPLELIMAAESELASLDWDGRPRPGLCAGFDVARKGDGAVIAIGEEVEDVTIVRGMIWMLHMKFADMRKIAEGVAEVVEASGGRFPVDATGIGAQIAEELHDKYPCVEPVQFGSSVETGARDGDGKAVKRPVKEAMAAEVKIRLEERRLRLPESERVRRAVQAIKRYIGPTGAIRLDAARTGQGHADEFWAIALMVAGLTGKRGYVPASEGGVFGEPVVAGLMGRVF